MVCGSRAAPLVQSHRDTMRRFSGVFWRHCCKPGWQESTCVTLAAIEKSRNKIAGYVFCCAPDNNSPKTRSVGHLKVDTAYQRQGVGTMIWLLRRSMHTRGDGSAGKPGFRCWPRIGVSEVATEKQASNKYRALLSSLLRASSTKRNGCSWLEPSEAQRLEEQGERGLGFGSSVQSTTSLPTGELTSYIYANLSQN